MKLDIELGQKEFTIQEPIKIKFTLKNNGSTKEIPLKFKTSDVLTLYISDRNGNVVSRADGYIKANRLSLRTDHIPQSDLETMTLDSSMEMQWEEDLLTYLDINKAGNYNIKAEFNFTPEKIKLESTPVAFKITENNIKRAEYLNDQITLNSYYFLQQLKDNSATKTLFHIVSPHEPTVFTQGVSFATPDTDKIYVSEGDFTRHDTFEHDFFRWVAWQEKKAIQLIAINEGSISTPLINYDPKIASPLLVGNPIQNEKKGVTLLLQDTSNAGTLQLHHLDSKGAPQNVDKIDIGTDKSKIISTRTDWQGNLFVITHDDNDHVVRVIIIDNKKKVHSSKLEVSDIIADSTAADKNWKYTLLAASPDIKANAGKNAAILLLMLAENKSQRMLNMIHVPVDNISIKANNIRISSTVFDNKHIDTKKESIVAGDIVQTSFTGLFSSVITSKGRVFTIRENSPASEQLSIETSHLTHGKLIDNSEGDIYFMYPKTGNGIENQIVFKIPSR